jgi:hypothetical protein
MDLEDERRFFQKSMYFFSMDSLFVHVFDL